MSMTRKDGRPRNLPAPLPLDPMPWRSYSGHDRSPDQRQPHYTFHPRPGFSQNEEDYG